MRVKFDPPTIVSQPVRVTSDPLIIVSQLVRVTSEPPTVVSQLVRVRFDPPTVVSQLVRVRFDPPIIVSQLVKSRFGPSLIGSPLVVILSTSFSFHQHLVIAHKNSGSAVKRIFYINTFVKYKRIINLAVFHQKTITMKFTSIHFSNIRVKELSDFLHVIFPILNALGVHNAKLKGMLVGLSLAMTELDGAIPKISLKGETRSVRENDDHRDGEFLTFRTFIEAFTHSRNLTIREQAMLIYDTLKSNGYYTLNSLPLKEESTAIRTLDELFKVGRLADALTALNGKTLWQNVVVAQEEFDGAKTNRSELEVAEDAGDAAFLVAKRAKAKCAEVFEMVEALYMVEDKAEYADAMTKVNLEIEALMALMRTRATLAAKAKEAKKKPSA